MIHFIFNYDQKLPWKSNTRLGPLSPQYIVNSEDLSNGKEEIDIINNEINEIHNAE
jgi:hypothetical protein